MPIVKLYANLRKLAGTRELCITGSTIRAVVHGFALQHPSAGEVIVKGGEIRRHILITLNGQSITDWETPVSEQDIVAIFPPIAGGTSPCPLGSPLLKGEGN